MQPRGHRVKNEVKKFEDLLSRSAHLVSGWPGNLPSHLSAAPTSFIAQVLGLWVDRELRVGSSLGEGPAPPRHNREGISQHPPPPPDTEQGRRASILHPCAGRRSASRARRLLHRSISGAVHENAGPQGRTRGAPAAVGLDDYLPDESAA